MSRALLAIGLVTAALAAGGPLHDASAHSLAAHMTEHVLLLLVAPLLLALATPAVRTRAPFGLLVVAFVLHTGAMVVWHLPGPFEAAVRHEALHAFEHLTMLGTGYLFWLFLLALPSRGMTVPVLFVASLPGTALGAAMTLATTSWYATAPSVGGQQLAGVIMWAFGGAVYVVAAAVMFGAWLADLDRVMA